MKYELSERMALIAAFAVIRKLGFPEPERRFASAILRLEDAEHRGYEFSFCDLQASEESIVITVKLDRNDGRWDTGIISTKTQTGTINSVWYGLDDKPERGE